VIGGLGKGDGAYLGRFWLCVLDFGLGLWFGLGLVYCGGGRWGSSYSVVISAFVSEWDRRAVEMG